jgi:hypothetical protein
MVKKSKHQLAFFAPILSQVLAWAVIGASGAGAADRPPDRDHPVQCHRPLRLRRPAPPSGRARPQPHSPEVDLGTEYTPPGMYLLRLG